MRRMTTAEIRKSFLDFFVSNGHRLVQSSPLIPADDPTLLFANAGMNQFKDSFLGREKRDYTRAATAQKCMRAGGKHNDLENVGFTARHHTFFEMLGNFSFGDYFKEDAIKLAWEWIAGEKWLGLPKDRLYATVFRDDADAFGIWENKIGLLRERIFMLGEKDNFWAMGDTGPCGPCSEIIFDTAAPACGPDCGIGKCDCDRFLEIWNLVFMQYNRDAAGNMTPLPKPSVDTGAGLERIAMVIQGKHSTFEIDIFDRIFEKIEKISGKKRDSSEPGVKQAMRVIADHARALTFAITDGVIPSNVGRGSVLRRILRRASVYGNTIGLNKPFMYCLVDSVVESLRDQYGELLAKQKYVKDFIHMEEEAFQTTLGDINDIYNRTISKLASNIIPGDIVFKFHTTYGQPLEYIQILANQIAKQIDYAGYNRLFSEHQLVSASATIPVQQNTEIALFDHTKFPQTEFEGYENFETESKLLDAKNHVAIFDKTPFYPEKGGQVSDTGIMIFEGIENNEILKVTNFGGYFYQHAFKNPIDKNLIGKTVILKVNINRRNSVCHAHTATHLMHAAMKEVLGSHANQTGSLVDEDKLHLDLTHPSAITLEQLEEIEKIVNGKINEKIKVETVEKSQNDARAEGATALFGEKYGETVRVVSVKGFSKELCGGTHVKNTAEVKLFKITSEGSVQAGVRRVEAFTGRKAEIYIKEKAAEYRELAAMLDVRDELVSANLEGDLVTSAQKIEREAREAAETLKAQRDQLKDRVRTLVDEIGGVFKPATCCKNFGGRVEELLAAAKEARKGKAAGRQKDLKSIADELTKNAEKIGETAVITALLPEAGGDDFRKIYDFVRAVAPSFAMALASSADGSARLFVALSDDLVKQGCHSGKLISEMARKVGGSGGGKPQFAQAGGKDPSGIEAALELFRSRIKDASSKKS
jgi:alanyl-tRNA synthetase